MSAFRRYDRVALVLSCRSTYENYCLPAGHGMTRVVHRGFDGNAGKAAKEYLDKRGIDRPATPFLAPEFTNPLFVSTSCRALEAAGLTAFPMGLDGLSNLFRFYIDGVQANLVRKNYDRFDPAKPVIWNALQEFAQELALRGVDALATDVARPLLEGFLYPPQASEHAKTFLFRLEDEGLLRREPNPESSGEDVSFTFQRFSDHFVAAAMLHIADTPAALAKAMRKSGDFAYLTADENAWRFAGVIEALMVQVPEKFGMELALIDQNFVADVSLPRRGFIEGLKIRTPASITVETIELFESQVTFEQGEAAYETLLELCSQPGHGLNGDYLHEQLAAMEMSNRDASWSPFLFRQLENAGPVETLIDWARSVDVSRAEIERLRLVVSTLCWFCSTSDRRVRDHATKSVANVFFHKPELILPTVERFLVVNDPYVRERVLACAYGALLHTRNQSEILGRVAAEAARVFHKPTLEMHAVIRDYARGIIELALKRNALPQQVDLEQCRPPYKSKKIENWPTVAVVKELEEKAGARNIVHSTVGYIDSRDEVSMAGDFGRYTMGGINRHFSAESRQGNAPYRLLDTKSEFWAAVASVDSEVAMLAENAKGPNSMSFVTSTNELAFLDMRFPGEWDGAVVINANLLLPILDANGLTPVWILGAEKDGGIGRGPAFNWSEETDRRSFGGMWWQSVGAWQGSTWASPAGWNEEASDKNSAC